MSELITEESFDLTHFKMNSVEVDGISGTRSWHLGYNPMFSLKDETTDTGRPWHWSAEIEVSEKHWLKCNVVIPRHSTCSVCDERDLDE